MSTFNWTFYFQIGLQFIIFLKCIFNLSVQPWLKTNPCILTPICDSFVSWHGSVWQILEAEGMAVPDEASCILQLVSEYLKGPCPITSVSDSQGPSHPEGFKHLCGDEGKGRREVHQVSWVRRMLMALVCTVTLGYGKCWNANLLWFLTDETVCRARRWSMIRVLSAASASAKLFPSSLLLKRTKRWWWGRKMGMARVCVYTYTHLLYYKLTVNFTISVLIMNHLCHCCYISFIITPTRWFEIT